MAGAVRTIVVAADCEQRATTNSSDVCCVSQRQRQRLRQTASTTTTHREFLACFCVCVPLSAFNTAKCATDRSGGGGCHRRRRRRRLSLFLSLSLSLPRSLTLCLCAARRLPSLLLLLLLLPLLLLCCRRSENARSFLETQNTLAKSAAAALCQSAGRSDVGARRAKVMSASCERARLHLTNGQTAVSGKTRHTRRMETTSKSRQQRSLEIGALFACSMHKRFPSVPRSLSYSVAFLLLPLRFSVCLSLYSFPSLLPPSLSF